MMRLSIITICYNNSEGLERTIRSIESQTCKDFEYIVVDGASQDQSVEVIHAHESCISKWISEPDTGIYNAMNKGVKMASGEYCLFINSGDELYKPTTVEEIYRHSFDEDFVQGVIYRFNKKDIFLFPPQEISLAFYIYGNNNYHQASLIKRKMLLERPYDEKYRIASDLKFNVESLIIHNCSYGTLDVVISKYEIGGISETPHRIESPEIYKELFPQRILNDYKRMKFCFRFPIKYIFPFLEKVGNLSILKKIESNKRSKMTYHSKE